MIMGQRIGGDHKNKSPPKWLVEIFAVITFGVIPAMLATGVGVVVYTIARKAVGAG